MLRFLTNCFQKKISPLKLGICLAVLLTLCTFNSAAFYSDSTMESDYPIIIVNDDVLNLNGSFPEIINNTAYAPIRILMNALGAQVYWNESLNSITIVSAFDNIVININEKTAVTLIHKTTFPIDVFMYNDLYYGSIRNLTRELGYEVDYIENSTNTPVIRIYKQEQIKLTNTELLYKCHLELVDHYNAVYKKIIENRRVVFLTFDDGPSHFTPQILDLLDSYGFKATFFMLSDYMKKYPDVIKRMVAEGHLPAIHGSTHFRNEVYKNDFSVRNSMDTANNVLKSIIGRTSLLCRVPYGSVPYMTKKQLYDLKLGGYKVWDWNIDSCDSKRSSVTSEYIISITTQGLGKHKESIILFHEKAVTLQALPTILRYIKDNNIVVKVLSEYMPGKSQIEKSFK